MDILERMKCKIIEDFPDITEDELATRLRLATHMIELNQYKDNTCRKELLEHVR